MSSWMNNLRNFGRQNNNNTNNTSNPNPNPMPNNSNPNPPRQNNPNQPPSRENASSPSPYSPSQLAPPNIPPSPSSSLSATMSVNDQAYQTNQGVRKPPFFFREDYAGFIVRGNFTTLSNQPRLVELGEWLAHQLVEQNRLLDSMIKCVSTEERTTGRPICNDQSCPSMTAGAATFTWIDTRGKTIHLPAMTYIKNIQTWIAGKIQDEVWFPSNVHDRAPPLPSPEQTAADPTAWTGKTSGFSQRFEREVQNMYKQMFRCYAHLYWSHWLDFWHLNVSKDLNTCFIHFVNVGRMYKLLGERDMEPMQPLIDIWIRNGSLLSRTAAAGGGEGAPAPASGATPGAASAASPVAVAPSSTA